MEIKWKREASLGNDESKYLPAKFTELPSESLVDYEEWEEVYPSDRSPDWGKPMLHEYEPLYPNQSSRG